MNGKSKVILAKKLWEQAQSKEELKQLIGNYMATAYPGYEVLEVHKYYAICEVGR